MTKPEYVRFCNQIHLLDLQANKGGKDGEATKKAKQDLVIDLVRSKTTNRSLGDGKPFPESPQSWGHDPGNYQDRSKEGNLMVGSPWRNKDAETRQQMAKTEA